MTSGPSLGRKRPRRAAIAHGATAPQQYAAALHKTQEFSKFFPPNLRRIGGYATGPLNSIFLNKINYLRRAFRYSLGVHRGHDPATRDFVNNGIGENA